ncbi:hypothetical protein AMECASPLE_032415 [Ameca splendens]|uniref:Uncharacterized protein n=1 Tax=Ameca splendens TaxID=208324 RepID=A0ABV0YHZ8_9TELE
MRRVRERYWEEVGEERRIEGKKGGGDGCMVLTSTSARNLFFRRKCIVMKVPAGQKSTANSKSQRGIWRLIRLKPNSLDRMGVFVILFQAVFIGAQLQKETKTSGSVEKKIAV